jgi:hypothetical protein
VSFAALCSGIAIGKRLARPPNAPLWSGYDRETAEVKERSVGLRWAVDNWKRGNGGSTTA